MCISFAIETEGKQQILHPPIIWHEEAYKESMTQDSLLDEYNPCIPAIQSYQMGTENIIIIIHYKLRIH